MEGSIHPREIGSKYSHSVHDTDRIRGKQGDSHPADTVRHSAKWVVGEGSKNVGGSWLEQDRFRQREISPSSHIFFARKRKQLAFLVNKGLACVNVSGEKCFCTSGW